MSENVGEIIEPGVFPISGLIFTPNSDRTPIGHVTHWTILGTTTRQWNPLQGQTGRLGGPITSHGPHVNNHCLTVGLAPVFVLDGKISPNVKKG